MQPRPSLRNSHGNCPTNRGRNTGTLPVTALARFPTEPPACSSAVTALAPAGDDELVVFKWHHLQLPGGKDGVDVRRRISSRQ